MKWLIVLLLLSTAVYANQPTPEVECCLYINQGYSEDTLPPFCSDYDIDFDNCEAVAEDWNSFSNSLNNPGPVNIVVLLVMVLLFVAVAFGLFRLAKYFIRKIK